MKQKLPTYRYGSLSYLEISNKIRVRNKHYPRYWAAEHAAQIRLYEEIGKDLKKLLAWLKKEYRKEFLLAFIITIAFTGKGYALAPTMSVKTLNVKKHVKHVAPVPAPSPPPVVVPPPAPVITWQENPNHCTDAQYIAADPPFNCIDKPAPPPPPVVPVYVAPAPVYVPPSGECQTYFSGDYYLDNIIRFESGGNSCATNPGGCFGLLQACPGEPLRAACGGSPSCQIAWFEANKTGGRSWAQVWQHEEQFGWW